MDPSTFWGSRVFIFGVNFLSQDFDKSTTDKNKLHIETRLNDFYGFLQKYKVWLKTKKNAIKKIYKYNILIYDTIIIMLNLHTHHQPFRSSSQLLSADVSLGDLDKVPQTSEKHLTTTTRSWENHLKSMAIHKNTTGVLSLSIYIYDVW